MEENIKLGLPENLEMPPEPPQKRAEEVGQLHKPARPEKNRGFDHLKQPEKPKAKQETEIKKATPEEAKAEAIRPKIDRRPVGPKGKIQRKAPKGQARPL